MGPRRLCYPAAVDPIQVRQAERDDALGVAALVLAMDREDGADARPGFLTEYADAWLLDVDRRFGFAFPRFADLVRVGVDRRPTWLAEESDGNPVGLVQTAMVRKLPSLRRPTTAWMHVALVFVRPTHRGRGIAERMLRDAVEWGVAQGVERFQLNAEPKARTLYERVGFTAPGERLMELRVPPRP